MEKKPLKIRFGDIPEGKSAEDYPEDTVFVLDDSDSAEDDSYWEED